MRALGYVIAFVAVLTGLPTEFWVDCVAGRHVTKQFRGRRSHFSPFAQNSGNSRWLSV
jgi:hypothetical protein